MKKIAFIPITAFLALIVLFILPGNNRFTVSAPEIMAEIQNRNYIVSVSGFMEILKGDPGPVLLADLRDTEKYEAGHLPGAINIPGVKQNPASLHALFRKLEGKIFLYSDQTASTCEWWILLTQMGLQNLYVLETGPDLDALIKGWPDNDHNGVRIDERQAFTFVPDTGLTVQ